jgi:hypothetical protein
MREVMAYRNLTEAVGQVALMISRACSWRVAVCTGGNHISALDPMHRPSWYALALNVAPDFQHSTAISGPAGGGVGSGFPVGAAFFVVDFPLFGAVLFFLGMIRPLVCVKRLFNVAHWRRYGAIVHTGGCVDNRKATPYTGPMATDARRRPATDRSPCLQNPWRYLCESSS